MQASRWIFDGGSEPGAPLDFTHDLMRSLIYWPRSLNNLQKAGMAIAAIAILGRSNHLTHNQSESQDLTIRIRLRAARSPGVELNRVRTAYIKTLGLRRCLRHFTFLADGASPKETFGTSKERGWRSSQPRRTAFGGTSEASNLLDPSGYACLSFGSWHQPIKAKGFVFQFLNEAIRLVGFRMIPNLHNSAWRCA